MPTKIKKIIHIVKKLTYIESKNKRQTLYRRCLPPIFVFQLK